MRLAALCLTALLLSAPANAQVRDPAWPDLRAELYGDRVLHEAGSAIVINAPYRTKDDARTQISASILAPRGKVIDNVSLILDENPMPVSAVFDFAEPLPGFFFDVTMRVNGPTPVHVVAETTDGQLYVAETFVKTSGLGACSAPPGTDPDLALATLGQMDITIETVKRTASLGDKLTAMSTGTKQVDVDISHPSHSGMQMDQISLLFIPMRYVENVEIGLDGKGYVDVTGSISLSENPRMSLSAPARTQSVDVTMTDTDGFVSKASKSVAGF